MRELLQALGDRDTLDALGIGTVRDAISDMLFPGTSTLHTRARYLLFLPWIYRQLADDGIAGAEARAEGRRRELHLVKALQRGAPNEEGIIGRVAGEALKVLPSAAYWAALQRYEILLRRGTWSEYCDRISVRSYLTASETEGDGQQQVGPWHGGLPPAPDGLLQETGMALSAEEGAYLRDRILTAAPGTTLAALLTRGDSLGGDPAPWASRAYGELNDHLRAQVDHAHAFSLVIHGAHIVYNAALVEALVDDGANPAELRKSVDEATATWLGEMAAHQDLVARWDRTEFWANVTAQNPRLADSTRRFVDGWTDLALADPAAVLSDEKARLLVINREVAMKGGLARLRSHRARQGVRGAQGLGRLDFRWFSVRRIVDDINDAPAAD